jgi:nucleoside-diphosphate-sugar epimerase
MRYLILGSAGQVGMELTKHLSKNNEVIKFDIEHESYQDLRIPFAVDDYMREADFVYFLAFDVGGSRYLAKHQKTFEFLDNNMRIMTNTFDSLRKFNKPFIFASSQMSNMNYSSYGVLKSIGEYYTKVLNGLTVKFWNVYGVEHDLEKSHVITDFIRGAKLNKRIDMLTDGTEERQMLHAADCCECMEILANQYDNISRNEGLHITSFDWVTIYEIAEIIAKNFRGTIINRAESKDNVQQNKRNQPDGYILKYWQPKLTIEEGIKNIIENQPI